MAVLSKSEFRQHLKARKLAPVYVLYGREHFLKRLAMQTIADFALSNPDLRDFNENTVSQNETSLLGALSMAEQLPVGDEKRVVILSDVFLSANKSKTKLLFILLRYSHTDPAFNTFSRFVDHHFVLI